MKNYVIGFTEETTTCDCCGRSELKGTYVIENSVTGGSNFFGSVCAFKKFNLNAKDLKVALKAAEEENIANAKAEYHQTQEYKAYTQQMIDRIPLLKGADMETYLSVTGESFRLSDLATQVKNAICKKFMVRKTYLV